MLISFRGTAKRRDKLKGLSKVTLRERSILSFVELSSVMFPGVGSSFHSGQSGGQLSKLMRPM
jgi:hypothetical protein